MLLDYHSLNVGQDGHSAGQKRQFQIICAVMFACFVYSAMTSGMFTSVSFADDSVHMGIFPGGVFTYKAAARDYAATFSLVRQLRIDLGVGKSKEYAGDDIIWSSFLDDPTKMGGRRQRWMTGLLLVGENHEHGNQDPRHDQLLALNEEIKKDPLTQDNIEFDAVIDIWPKVPYEQADLPSVNSLVLHFPQTGGFVSSLVFSYKIIPKLRQIAREQKLEDDYEPVILSQCSARESMCTHYVPLLKSKEFLMGRKPSDEHNEELGQEHFLDWAGMKNGMKKLAPYLAKYVDKLP